MIEDIYEGLVKAALYAIRSNDENLIYECLGAVNMARMLDAITKEEYKSLDAALFPDGINDVANRKERAKTITADDIRRAR